MWKSFIGLLVLIHCAFEVSSQSTWTCPACEGFFAIPGTCGRDYYVCVLGSPYVSSCPSKTVFDPVTLKCVNEDSASCIFRCPSMENDFYPSMPGVCSNTYYVCVTGTAYQSVGYNLFQDSSISRFNPFEMIAMQKCPGDSVFDPYRKVCVDKSKCGVTTTTSTSTTIRTTTTTPTTTTTRTTTTTPTTTTTRTTTRPTTTRPSFTCTQSGNFPYGDCSPFYYLCVTGNPVPVLATCPSGMVFNPVIQYCEPPEKVETCKSLPLGFLSIFTMKSKLTCTI